VAHDQEPTANAAAEPVDGSAAGAVAAEAGSEAGADAGEAPVRRTRRERGAELYAAARARADAARARAEATRTDLEQRRSSNPWVDTGLRLHEANAVIGGIVLAGALAFRLFLFFIPYVFTFVVGLGQYSTTASAEEAAQAGGMSGLAATAVADAASMSQGARWTALATGAIATLWAARGLYRVMRLVYGLAWQVQLPSVRRPWLAPIVIVALTAGVGLNARGLKWTRDHLGGTGIGLTILAGVAMGALWLLVSLHLPRADGTRWVDVLPGAVLVGVGGQALHLATVVYFVGRVASLGERYGSMGTALGVLSWAYMLGWLMTMAAILNAVVHGVRNRPDAATRVTSP
jgi:uncharacterized BrkB/YihY/UPF0761 family membrane protein